MSSRSIKGQRARATIAVIALYALVLQAFLTGLLPISGAQAHGFAELCSPVQDDGGAPKKHDGKSCCVTACASLAAPLPQVDTVSLAWPRLETTLVVFSGSPSPPARAPPIHDQSARGPPQA